jgi:hypothetical protein
LADRDIKSRQPASVKCGSRRETRNARDGGTVGMRPISRFLLLLTPEFSAVPHRGIAPAPFSASAHSRFEPVYRTRGRRTGKKPRPPEMGGHTVRPRRSVEERLPGHPLAERDDSHGIHPLSCGKNQVGCAYERSPASRAIAAAFTSIFKKITLFLLRDVLPFSTYCQNSAPRPRGLLRPQPPGSRRQPPIDRGWVFRAASPIERTARC